MKSLMFGGSGKIGAAVAWDLVEAYDVETASIGALLIGRGAITSKGIVPPEDAIKGRLYTRFMDELRKREIEIIEVAENVD